MSDHCHQEGNARLEFIEGNEITLSLKACEPFG
jgi:hypothetical protein